LGAYEIPILRWIHILAMVYWLGGEWGVFQTSRYIINSKLTMDERRRHMETAYRIDILARTGIIMLLPLGLHLGNLWGVQPYGGGILALFWVLSLAWLALCWAAFIYRETDKGIRLTKLDEQVRFVLIPVLLVSSISSLTGFGPFNAEDGQRWYSTKILLYSLLLVLGLKLRFIMREWTMLFRKIAAEGSTPAVEDQLARSLRIGRGIAYCYWVGIASVAFFGATKIY
jgi:hypothetical protein